MQTQMARLLLPDDLHGAGSAGLPDGDLAALRAVADWIKAFVVNPHPDLGRPGPVCPFVPEALARGTLWLAAERIADHALPEVVDVIRAAALRVSSVERKERRKNPPPPFITSKLQQEASSKLRFSPKKVGIPAGYR